MGYGQTLEKVTPARLKKIQGCTGQDHRRHVWSQLRDGLPASKVAGTDLGKGVVVLNVDATVSDSQRIGSRKVRNASRATHGCQKSVVLSTTRHAPLRYL